MRVGNSDDDGARTLENGTSSPGGKLLDPPKGGLLTRILIGREQKQNKIVTQWSARKKTYCLVTKGNKDIVSD